MNKIKKFLFFIVLFLLLILFLNLNLFAQNFNIELNSFFNFINLNSDSVFNISIFDLNNFDQFIISQLKFAGLNDYFTIFINIKYTYYINSLYNSTP